MAWRAFILITCCTPHSHLTPQLALSEEVRQFLPANLHSYAVLFVDLGFDTEDAVRGLDQATLETHLKPKRSALGP
jgi:hypothetical protein